VYDDKGNPVKQPRIRYASIDPSRLTVDPLGNVRAVGNGLGHLVATAEGRTSLPVAVLVSGFGWVSVSTGADITCGIRTGGFGYCWGDNAGGRMGSDPPVADSDRPLLIAGGLRFAQISAAQGQHSCGVTLSAELYCWGMNDHGQLGNGQTSSVRLPVRVSGGLSWASVTVGLAHTCGITTTGMAYCWGLNSQGQLGVGAPAGAELTVPTAVFSGQPYRSISAGPEHTCAINANGSALCWGSNGAGEVGHGTTGGIYTVPQLVQGLTAGVQELAAAEVATNCARTTTVVCWGGNTFGLILEAQPISRNRPGPPLTISPVPSQVGLGIVYACALRPTGQPPLFGPQGPSEAICWGVFGNRAGIFNPPWSTQVRVVPRTYGLAQLRVGRVHACGITGTGHLLCWGGGQSGESTVRGGTPNSEPVEVP
jgi:alpha-tubulin suppressor-like RCC1 family protein